MMTVFKKNDKEDVIKCCKNREKGLMSKQHLFQIFAILLHLLHFMYYHTITYTLHMPLIFLQRLVYKIFTTNTIKLHTLDRVRL